MTDILTLALPQLAPIWLGGANFNNDRQKAIFAHYSDQAITIEDGHLDAVCAALKSANMACYLGLIERPRNRTGHSLYCSYVYIDQSGTVQSIHRKLQPTYEERLVWSPGDGNGLVTHRLGAPYPCLSQGRPQLLRFCLGHYAPIRCSRRHTFCGGYSSEPLRDASQWRVLRGSPRR